MVNPIHIEQVPQTAQAILDRINTLSFNSSLMREMRAINFVNRLVESGFDDGGRLKKMLIHCIDAEDEMSKLGVSSKLNVGRDFLGWLFELGRGASRHLPARSFRYDRQGLIDLDRAALSCDHRANMTVVVCGFAHSHTLRVRYYRRARIQHLAPA